jgi:hypothetical protein
MSTGMSSVGSASKAPETHRGSSLGVDRITSDRMIKPTPWKTALENQAQHPDEASQ